MDDDLPDRRVRDVDEVTLTEVPIAVLVGKRKIVLQLCQLDAPLTETLRPDAAHVERQIQATLDTAHATSCGLGVTVYPEASVPVSGYEMVVEAHRSLGRPAISVVGLELLRADAMKEALDFEAFNDVSRDQLQLIDRAEPDQLVNLTAIVVTDSETNVTSYAQLKLAASSEELTPYSESSLLCGEELLVLRGKDISLAALTCSDFFSRSPTRDKRNLDELEYQYIRTTLPGSGLNFLVNHQYNRSPDHPFFNEGLTRLFADRDYARRLVVATANAVDSKARVVGRSRALFHAEVRVLPTDAITEASAPVRGYHLGSTPGSMLVTLESPPHYWIDDQPLISCRAADVGGNTQQVGTYVPPIRRTPIRFSGESQLISRLSALGDYKGAEGLAKEALARVPKWEHLRRAESCRIIAQQRRNRGETRTALSALAAAETELAEIESEATRVRLERWRIEYQRVFLETLQERGQYSLALQRYRSIEESIKTAVEQEPEGPDRQQLVTYLGHAERQCAEVHYLLGDYRTSLKMHQDARKSYSWFNVREIAYAKKGEADSLRMQGKSTEARALYRDIIRYCDAEGNLRLRNRASIGLLELDRTEPGLTLSSTEDLLERVSEASERSISDSYRLGNIQCLLIEAAMLLERDPEASAARFKEAAALCEGVQSGRGGRDRLASELPHCVLGSAEASRYMGDHAGGLAQYARASKLYRQSGMPWGERRADLGIEVCSASGAPAKIPRTADYYLRKIAPGVANGVGPTLFGCVPWR
ncbi:hypothetical protein [Actinomycetospora atypica]|uniref:Uncharacterized protein n=1 Tax=Actinomycetospora atypica TaxID=1290095 RepID=A0ABV9YN25_9PSEU